MMAGRVLFACAALAAMAAPVGADSLDPPDRARALSDQGRVYHQAGDYDHAIDSFKAAYELAPSPALLFNLGQAYRLKGDCGDAALMYRNYLRSEPDRRLRDLARAHLGTVEQCMSRRASMQPLLGAGAGSTTASGGGGSVAIDRPSEPGVGLRRGGLGVTLGGGVLLGVGVYYAIRAANASDEVEQLYADGARWPDIEAADARGRRASTLATVFAIGGGAAAITGGVMYLLGRREAARAERGRPAFSIAPHPGGGEVRVAWVF